MKLKYLTFIAAAATTLSASMTSCQDSFLDEKMYSNYPPETQSPDAEVVGLYRLYSALWGMSSNQGFLSVFQVGTDVATPGQVEGIEIPFYRYNELNSESGAVSFLWERLYEIIANANLIIAKQEALEDAANKGYIAEAKFFRAYAYNMLNTFWGDTDRDLGVPLVLEANFSTPRTDYTRAKVSEVDNAIVDDLEYCIENLPNVGEAKEESRANKDMARQLAGEVYLRIGMRDNSYYAKSEQVLTDIIDGGNYSLIQARYGNLLDQNGDYYNDMFHWGNQRRSQGNTETIWTFEMEYNRDVNGGTIDNPQHRRVWVAAYYSCEGMVNADSLGGRGLLRLRLSNFMKYGLYEKGDIRNSNYNLRRVLYLNSPGFNADGSIVYGLDQDGFRVNWYITNDAGEKVKNPEAVEGTMFVPKVGDRYVIARGDTLTKFAPYITKWGAYDTNDDFGYAMVKDWPLMRLGETYLLRAEARFRQGNTAGAAEDINKLRDRAFKEYREQTGDVNVGKVDASQIDMNFILDERARELIGEENRRMTLVRTKMLKERISDKYQDKVLPEERKIYGFQDYNLLFPIPLTEIQLNKDATLEQNTGYDI